MDTIEDKYEAIQRKRKLIQEQPASERELLPLKIGKTVKSNVIKQQAVVPEPLEENGISANESTNEPTSENHFVNIYVEQLAKATEKRRLIAISASKLLESPHTELARLKEILSTVQSVDIRYNAKLWTFGVVTLCELFKDILPSYRIRVATEKEKQQKAKKETKQLRQQEEQILANYRHYLTYLERYLPKRLSAMLKSYPVPKEAITNLSSTVVKCFGELLVDKPSFNFSQNIMRTLVPLTNSGNTEISSLACHYIEALFQVDKSQEVALEAVRVICRYVKKRKYSVRPEMIRVFLKLKIRQVDFEAPAREREEKRLRRLKFKLLSKKEQKRQKDLDKVNKQLEAAGAVENEKRKLALQTAIVEQLFSVYFFVLKSATASTGNVTGSPLLSAVLEGMAQFSKFMSVDYYDDLFRTFGLLLESGKLSPHQSLNCIRSAFRMLQGEGESLEIDPTRFYRHLYVLLMTGDYSKWPTEDFHALLDCLEFMLVKRRKHLSNERLFAFAKRIATAAVSCSPDSAYVISFLVLLRKLFNIFPALDRLLDSSPYRPGGIFRNDIEDPEHCSAEGAFLHELSLLQSSQSPTVAGFAAKFVAEHAPSDKPMKNTNISLDLDAYCRLSAREIFARHSLLADLPKDEEETADQETTKTKRKVIKKAKLVSNLVNNVPIPSFNPKLAPAVAKNQDGENVVANPNHWNRKTRRAHRFGKAR